MQTRKKEKRTRQRFFEGEMSHHRDDFIFQRTETAKSFYQKTETGIYRVRSLPMYISEEKLVLNLQEYLPSMINELTERFFIERISRLDHVSYA